MAKHVFVIVDDDARRNAIAEHLSQKRVVHKYMTAREFLMDTTVPSSGVAIIGARLREKDGILLAKEMEQSHPEIKCIILAGAADAPDAILSNPHDIAIVPIVYRRLEEQVSKAFSGETYSERELVKSFERLTDREMEILTLVIEGKSSREIGLHLEVSTKTVEAHRSKIMSKTRAADVGELFVMFRQWSALKVTA